MKKVFGSSRSGDEVSRETVSAILTNPGVQQKNTDGSIALTDHQYGSKTTETRDKACEKTEEINWHVVPRGSRNSVPNWQKTRNDTRYNALMRRTQTRDPRNLHELPSWRLPSKRNDESDRSVVGITVDLSPSQRRSVSTTNPGQQDAGSLVQRDESSVALPNDWRKSSIGQLTYDMAKEKRNQIEWPMLTKEPQNPGRTNSVSCWQKGETVKVIKDELSGMRRNRHEILAR